jgi:hypothetical protein
MGSAKHLNVYGYTIVAPCSRHQRISCFILNILSAQHALVNAVIRYTKPDYLTDPKTRSICKMELTSSIQNGYLYTT